MKFLSSLFAIFEAIAVFAVVFFIMKWYIKGHFGKYFILFWAYTIIVIFTYYDNKAKEAEIHKKFETPENWDNVINNYKKL
jgi:hypothetical protein